MTTTLKLQILAQDILESDYTVSKDCAITRALHRAGRTDLKDGGVLRLDNDDYTKLADTNNNQSYFELVYKVLGMYYTKDHSNGKSLLGYGYVTNPMKKRKPIELVPIEDFEHTLIFEE